MRIEVEIEGAPWLLSYKEVSRLFGLSYHELRKLEDGGVIHRCRTSRKGKFFKMELLGLGRRATECPPYLIRLRSERHWTADDADDTDGKSLIREIRVIRG